MYGQKIDKLDHEYVVAAQVAMEGLSEATAIGRFWVEAFPVLRHIPSWVPWTGARRLAEKYLPIVTLAREKPFQEVEHLAVSIFDQRSIDFMLINLSQLQEKRHSRAIVCS